MRGEELIPVCSLLRTGLPELPPSLSCLQSAEPPEGQSTCHYWAGKKRLERHGWAGRVAGKRGELGPLSPAFVN